MSKQYRIGSVVTDQNIVIAFTMIFRFSEKCWKTHKHAFIHPLHCCCLSNLSMMRLRVLRHGIGTVNAIRCAFSGPFAASLPVDIKEAVADKFVKHDAPHRSTLGNYHSAAHLVIDDAPQFTIAMVITTMKAERDTMKQELVTMKAELNAMRAVQHCKPCPPGFDEDTFAFFVRQLKKDEDRFDEDVRNKEKRIYT
ncbi:Hypothetical protein, putative, partial [Bodo saltans]